MRTIFMALLCFLAFSSHSQPGVRSATFIVKGNCDECRANIENAADIKGVKLLTWNEKTKVASVTYSSDKVDILTIQNAIAARGYDAGEVRGNEKAYNKLPKCCKYRDGDCKEK